MFFLSRTSNNLDDERKKLTEMLSGFRISYSEVTVIPLQILLWAPDVATREEFTLMIQGAGITEEELEREAGKTNRYSFILISKYSQALTQAQKGLPTLIYYVRMHAGMLLLQQNTALVIRHSDTYLL